MRRFMISMRDKKYNRRNGSITYTWVIYEIDRADSKWPVLVELFTENTGMSRGTETEARNALIGKGILPEATTAYYESNPDYEIHLLS